MGSLINKVDCLHRLEVDILRRRARATIASIYARGNTSERHVPKHLSNTIPALESVEVLYGGNSLTPGT